MTKCYWFEDSETHGWSYAEDICTSKGGHLVAIHSQEENSFVLGRAVLTKADQFWIGLMVVLN